MQVVYKYPISISDAVTLKLPRGARIVHLGMDANNVPCVWALVDRYAGVSTPREFCISGTGAVVSDNKEYIGTFFDMPFVWHVFADKL